MKTQNESIDLRPLRGTPAFEKMIMLEDMETDPNRHMSSKLMGTLQKRVNSNHKVILVGKNRSL